MKTSSAISSAHSRARRPEGGLAARGAVAVLRFYKRFVSPLLPPACRFEPTCSVYAAEAIGSHGFVRGSILAAGRLLRCHPFSRGGADPVPPPTTEASWKV